LPRKYRPPAAKRRKPKKTGPYVYEGAPEAVEGEDAEVAAAPDELDDEEWAGDPQETVVVAAEGRPKGREPARHLVKDYSYVRGEIVRILSLASFLIVSLLITAAFRN
jgi:hypothetical protein